ncbi:hypothetical protein GCM10020229_26600 [Kitasatospora albolonga]
MDKLRHFYNHPGFVEPMVDATLAALEGLPAAARDGAHLAFTTHSIPDAMADGSGPPTTRPGASPAARTWPSTWRWPGWSPRPSPSARA